MVESELFSKADYQPAKMDTDAGVAIPALFPFHYELDTVGHYSASSAEANIYTNRRDSIAHISVSDRQGHLEDQGTGFFVDRDGLLATAFHVVKDPGGAVTILTADGKVHSASVVDVDPKKDLALLKVAPLVPGETFQPAPLGNSHLGVDQQVIAMGFPRNSDVASISPGMTSVYGMDISYGSLPQAHPLTSAGLAQPRLANDGRLLQPASETGDDPNRRVIGILAHIEPGQSGCPAFDLAGNVIGVADMTNKPSIAIFTPVEDLSDLIRHSQRTFPTAAAYSSTDWIPKWLASRSISK